MPSAERSSQLVRGQKTICIPCSLQQYEQVVDDPEQFRKLLDQQIEATPELFPPEIRRGYRMKDLYTSRKTGCKLRRSSSATSSATWSDPPSSCRTSRAAPRTCRPPFSPQVRCPVLGSDRYLRPLADVLVSPGTLARPVQPGRDDGPGGQRLPRHLVADEKHTTSIENKSRRSIWRPLPGGCCPGMALAESADADELTRAYGVFRDGRITWTRSIGRRRSTPTAGRPPGGLADVVPGRDVDPLFPPCVPADPGAGRPPQGDVLRPAAAGLQAYHAPYARSFSQRLRRLREWVKYHVVKEVVREKVLALCAKRSAFVRAYAHPGRYPRVILWTGRCGACITTCTARSICTARRRPRAGPARLGVDPQLCPVVPGDGAAVTGAAEPSRAAQRDAVSLRVAPEPAGLGVTRGLSQASPKSVTSREVLRVADLRAGPGACGSGAHPAALQGRNRRRGSLGRGPSCPAAEGFGPAADGLRGVVDRAGPPRAAQEPDRSGDRLRAVQLGGALSLPRARGAEHRQ